MGQDDKGEGKRKDNAGRWKDYESPSHFHMFPSQGHEVNRGGGGNHPASERTVGCVRLSPDAGGQGAGR